MSNKTAVELASDSGFNFSLHNVELKSIQKNTGGEVFGELFLFGELFCSAYQSGFGDKVQFNPAGNTTQAKLNIVETLLREKKVEINEIEVTNKLEFVFFELLGAYKKPV